MPDGGARPRRRSPRTVNAERVERMRRYPRLRDRSIFVGNPGDLVDDPLGPGLPTVRDWTLERYAFAGYVTGSDAGGRTGRRCAPSWATGPTSGSAW